jgi:hypothetical protein
MKETRDKRSSLLCARVSEEGKKFWNIETWKADGMNLFKPFKQKGFLRLKHHLHKRFESAIFGPMYWELTELKRMSWSML